MIPADPDRLEALIRRETRRLRPPLVPELEIWGGDDYARIWEATEATLEANGLEPPFWAFAWVGGQVLARYLLDRPETVAGRVALSIAAGSGLEALAAAKAGAARVIANDIDPAALTVIGMNAALNRLTVEISGDDYLAGAPMPAADLLLAGDIFYEKAMADRLEPLLRRAARDGALVLVGDPGRGYLPSADMEPLAAYDTPTPLALESAASLRGTVFRLHG